MSTGTIEVTWLEGVDLENSPPCEVTVVAGDPFDPSLIGRPCSSPSVARVMIHCTCGSDEAEFICLPHLRELRAGNQACKYCHTANFTWSES